MDGFIDKPNPGFLTQILSKKGGSLYAGEYSKYCMWWHPQCEKGAVMMSRGEIHKTLLSKDAS